MSGRKWRLSALFREMRCLAGYDETIVAKDVKTDELKCQLGCHEEPPESHLGSHSPGASPVPTLI